MYQQSEQNISFSELAQDFEIFRFLDFPMFYVHLHLHLHRFTTLTSPLLFVFCYFLFSASNTGCVVGDLVKAIPSLQSVFNSTKRSLKPLRTSSSDSELHAPLLLLKVRIPDYGLASSQRVAVDRNFVKIAV